MVAIQKKLKYYKDKKVGKRYRHFKGTVYLVSDIVIDCEMLDLLVIYKNFENPLLAWARPLKEFESEVDREKYPDVNQKLRFEPLEPEERSCILTEAGEKTVKVFIQECEAKRKEILDARIDTADDTTLPTVEDIRNDIMSFVDEKGCYYNCWGVTDHYDSDLLSLERNVDFYM